MGIKNEEVWYLFYHGSFFNLLYCKDKINTIRRFPFKAKFPNHPSLTIRVFVSLSVTATHANSATIEIDTRRNVMPDYGGFSLWHGVEFPKNITKMDSNS